MPDQDFKPRDAIYSPGEASTLSVNAIDQNQRNSQGGLPWMLPGIDGYQAPMVKGKLYCIIGQTSNGKTMLFEHIENGIAEMLRQGNLKHPKTPDVIIHVSVEDLVEEQMERQIAVRGNFNPSDLALGQIQDMQAIRRAAAEARKSPIFRIGESLARPDVMQHLNVRNMARCIDLIASGELWDDIKPNIRLLVFDYLQAFPLDKEAQSTEFKDQRRLQVRSDIYHLRRLAARYAPVLTAVQAKQTMAGNNPPLMLPGVFDGEESSAIGQRSDAVWTIWMPKTTNTVGSLVEKGVIKFYVEEDQMLIKVAKQRGNLPAGRIFMTKIDYTDRSFSVVPFGSTPAKPLV